MSTQITADPAELWDLYTTIGEAKAEADNECEELVRTLMYLCNRIQEKCVKILQQIEELEAQAAQLRAKAQAKKDDGESGDAEEAQAEALEAYIRRLELQLEDLKHCASRASSYERMIHDGKKSYTKAMRSASMKVNKYIKFLEQLLMESDYAAYSQSKESGSAGGRSGSFHTMSFRGITFYCSDSSIDLEQKDSAGRTNLQRMESGLAPYGSDGLPMNLHHMQQSQNYGGIMELPESTHQQNHGTLHINTHDIPSGVNRNTFSHLKTAYWKRRAAFIKRDRGL